MPRVLNILLSAVYIFSLNSLANRLIPSSISSGRENEKLSLSVLSPSPCGWNRRATTTGETGTDRLPSTVIGSASITRSMTHWPSRLPPRSRNFASTCGGCWTMSRCRKPFLKLGMAPDWDQSGGATLAPSSSAASGWMMIWSCSLACRRSPRRR